MALAGKHDTRLAELERWFGSLPPGTADMRLETVEDDPGGIHVAIRPLHQPQAASIRLRIDEETGFVYLGAGKAYSLDDTVWPSMPLADVCQAVVSGGLTETIRLHKGKETGVEGWLRVEGEAVPVHSNRTADLGGELRRALSRDKRRLVIEYPAYYDGEPH